MDQEQYWNDNQREYQYVPVEKFAESFCCYYLDQQFENKQHVGGHDKCERTNAISDSYRISNWKVFKACFSRELLLLKRNSPVHIFKSIQIMILALVTMTLFLRTNMDHHSIAGGNKFIGAIFTGVMIVNFNGMTELAMIVKRLPVFYKQRELLHLPGWALLSSIYILSIPMTLIETGIWTSLWRPKETDLERNQDQMQSMSTNPPPPDTTSSTSDGSRRRFGIPFIRKINWGSVVRYSKKWVKHPMNIALLVWLFFVASCLVVLFLLMTGILNHTIPKSSVRKKWTEIFNQILNAFFTIMCLYQHPRISHHLVLLCQWKPNDIVELRNVYCKNGTKKRNERAHMMFVVFLLQITCISQYGLCTLYWAYTSKTRPDWPQILFIALGTGAPIIAALYTVFSPLGRKIESESDEESQRHNSEDKELKLYKKSVVVTSPQWVGGLFNCWDDLTVYFLSFFCTFCVFGWNMERLGFGNMYVHIITFILLCSAPLVVFSVTALNINDYTIRYVVGIAGIVLCLCGFLYGGFWRTQMRKRFKLPANPFCFGFLAFADFMQWLFCWSCSLAQEVRTGNFYDVENDRFYRNESEEGSQRVLELLPAENEAGLVIVSTLESEAGSKCTIEQGIEMDIIITGKGEGEDDEAVRDEMMRPPLQPLIKPEERQPES